MGRQPRATVHPEWAQVHLSPTPAKVPRGTTKTAIEGSVMKPAHQRLILRLFIGPSEQTLARSCSESLFPFEDVRLAREAGPQAFLLKLHHQLPSWPLSFAQ